MIGPPDFGRFDQTKCGWCGQRAFTTIRPAKVDIPVCSVHEEEFWERGILSAWRYSEMRKHGASRTAIKNQVAARRRAARDAA